MHGPALISQCIRSQARTHKISATYSQSTQTWLSSLTLIIMISGKRAIVLSSIRLMTQQADFNLKVLFIMR